MLPKPPPAKKAQPATASVQPPHEPVQPARDSNVPAFPTTIVAPSPPSPPLLDRPPPGPRKDINNVPEQPTTGVSAHLPSNVLERPPPRPQLVKMSNSVLKLIAETITAKEKEKQLPPSFQVGPIGPVGNDDHFKDVLIDLHGVDGLDGVFLQPGQIYKHVGNTKSYHEFVYVGNVLLIKNSKMLYSLAKGSPNTRKIWAITSQRNVKGFRDVYPKKVASNFLSLSLSLSLSLFRSLNYFYSPMHFMCRLPGMLLRQTNSQSTAVILT